MTKKLSNEQRKVADNILARLDQLAGDIQAKYGSWGMPFDQARTIVQHIDRIADDYEKSTYGEASLVTRAAKLMKQAQVVEKENDEPYMSTYSNPMSPVQTEADEPYMSAYEDDQSSAVIHGKSTSGRPLAPGH